MPQNLVSRAWIYHLPEHEAHLECLCRVLRRHSWWSLGEDQATHFCVPIRTPVSFVCISQTHGKAMRILGTMGSWLQKVLYSGPHQNGALALFHLAVLTTTLLCFLILMGGTYDSSVCWPPEGFQFCHMQVNTGLCPSLGNAFPVPLQNSTCLSLKVRAGAQRGFLSPDDLNSLPTSNLIHPLLIVFSSALTIL